MAQTSLLAFTDLKVSGELGRQEALVYFAVRKLQPVTDNELSRYLGLRINVVTARRNSLVKKGFVSLSGLKEDEFTNKLNKTYEVNEYVSD